MILRKEYLDNLIFDNKELLVMLELLKQIDYTVLFVTKVNKLFFDKLFKKLNRDISDIIYIKGSTWKTKNKDYLPTDAIFLPTYRDLKTDRLNYAKSFYVQYTNTDPFSSKPLVEEYNDIYVVQKIGRTIVLYKQSENAKNPIVFALATPIKPVKPNNHFFSWVQIVIK